jgi:glutathione peroxidase
VRGRDLRQWRRRRRSLGCVDARAGSRVRQRRRARAGRRPRGLVVVGFPSDSFDQEAADAAETAAVCYVNYGVKFTMVETTPVTGPDANPVFRELARQSRAPAWNFEKYLVGADGKVVGRFDSRVTPESAELASAIERVLRQR